MIDVQVRLRLKDGDQSGIRAAALDLIAATRKEDGCLAYELFVSLSDPTLWCFLESWRDRDALAAHNEAPHIVQWRAATTGWFLDRSVKLRDVEPEPAP